MKDIILIFMVVAMCLFAIAQATDIPEVFITQDNICIAVINADASRGSCDSLPYKYSTTIVAYR